MEKNSRKCKNLLFLRNLRHSLKYRPKILKLILKMRQTIRMKNTLLNSLKHKLGTNAAKIVISTQTESNVDTNEKIDFEDNILSMKKNTEINILDLNNIKDTSTQTSEFNNSNEKIDKIVKHSYTQTEEMKSINYINEKLSSSNNGLDKAWEIQDNGETNKSIAEQVKEVAQSVIQETGMVYVESAGMYYDYKTGYYYNSELGLYYHTDTGCYYHYCNEKKSFVFHSYPDKSAENESLKAHERRKAKKHKKAAKSDDIENLTKLITQDNEESKPKRKKTSKEIKKTEDVASENGEQKKDGEMKIDELEDGECSDTASESDDDKSTSTATDDESVAKHHPPCMRIIVRETNLPKLKVGTLYLITKDGGSLGREGEHHAIIIRDHNVSRNHLDIKYDMDRRMYTAVDIGSKNGTILNGSRMSETQKMSCAMKIVHGSIIQLGETKLLCHIHAGNDTCGHCEPGLIMETLEKEKVAYTRSCSVQKQHQLELARLKNKYAPQPLAIEETAYNDRAQARREKVGSSHHSEKTQSSDINTFIAEENKGFKLLEKMGWSKGEGLGKDSQGDTEPVPLVSNEGKTGLGAARAPVVLKGSKTLGPATLRLAARTKMLQPPAKAFQDPMEEDSE